VFNDCKFPNLWNTALPCVLFAYCEVPVETLGCSPLDLFIGRTNKCFSQATKSLSCYQYQVTGCRPSSTGHMLWSSNSVLTITSSRLLIDANQAGLPRKSPENQERDTHFSLCVTIEPVTEAHKTVPDEIKTSSRITDALLPPSPEEPTESKTTKTLPCDVVLDKPVRTSAGVHQHELSPNAQPALHIGCTQFIPGLSVSSLLVCTPVRALGATLDGHELSFCSR